MKRQLLYFLPLSLLLIAFILIRTHKQVQTINDLGTPSPAFGEKSEYVNKQAKFSVSYPSEWTLEVPAFEDESTHGIRVRGKQGYVDFSWAPEHDKGGCSVAFTNIRTQSGDLEVCNFKQKNDSEVWNQLVAPRGDFILWSNAYAASPSATTRQAILDVYSSLKFTE
jgi:hypothetical protein